MTRPGPLGRRRAPSSSSTSSSSTMASGGIRRSGISAPGPSSDGWITKHRQLNPGVYEIGASPRRINVLDVQSNSQIRFNQWHGLEDGEAISSPAAEVVDLTGPWRFCELM